MTYTTPGVYIKEISKFPASVAPVATAVPAFIGYTELDGNTGTTTKAVRITSMLDYETKFGGPYPELYAIALTDSGTTVDYLDSVGGGEVSPYLLYYQLQMYFANGGGPCYIVSVGTYDTGNFPNDFPDTLPGGSDMPQPSSINPTDLDAGIEACKKVDEITLLAVPEAIHLNAAGRRAVNDKMLAQCAALQDRFAILDVFTDLDDAVGNVVTEGSNFRNEVSTDNLAYGAAYYPALITTLGYSYDEGLIKINDTRTNPVYDGERLSSLLTGEQYASPGTELGTKAEAKIEIVTFGSTDTNTLNINGVIITFIGTGPAGPNQVVAETSNDDTASNLKDFIDNHTMLGQLFDTALTGAELTLTAATTGTWANDLPLQYSGGAADLTVTAFSGGVDSINKALYNEIKAALSRQKLLLHPCGAMAGIYARVDNNRGVWKAPANVSLRSVAAPFRMITHEEHGGLNIDPTAGKSINAVRTFAGKGNLVWGARTLAGNDNEWRYVSVRRLFIFMEESIKKATEHSIFEPNDANTWNRVRGMIENFLTGLWRDGALAGAKPEHAFYVKVGLGVTMSEADILNGIMNIEIGAAAVRPAEFIVLKFSHKLQQS